jgi:hypothetical protein
MWVQSYVGHSVINTCSHTYPIRSKIHKQHYHGNGCNNKYRVKRDFKNDYQPTNTCVEVKDFLRLTISQSVRLGIEPLPGDHDQIYL